jgi:hypothetical protein
LSRNRFDLLLLDIRLPDANGLDLLKTIRGYFPGVRVIVISGDGSAENMEAALSGGAEQFLEKPFEIDIVKRYVSGALRDFPCKRKHSRYLCNFPLRLSVLVPSLEEEQFFLGSMEGSAEDIARNGIRLTTDYPLRAGQGVRLMIDGKYDPFAKMVPGEGCAEVVWAASRGNRSTAGLRFLSERPYPS